MKTCFCFKNEWFNHYKHCKNTVKSFIFHPWPWPYRLHYRSLKSFFQVLNILACCIIFSFNPERTVNKLRFGWEILLQSLVTETVRSWSVVKNERFTVHLINICFTQDPNLMRSYLKIYLFWRSAAKIWKLVVDAILRRSQKE